MKRTYEAWQDGDGLAVAFAPRDGIQELRDKNLLPEDATLLFSVDADSFEEALAIYHLRMGWEPFRPEGKSSPCPKCGAQVYASGSGECWKCGNKV
jgi:hypothetical protein